MSNLQTSCHLQPSSKSLIHDTKHHKDNYLQIL